MTDEYNGGDGWVRDLGGNLVRVQKKSEEELSVGDQGPVGNKGATGNKGAVGDQGPVGDKGATGNKGAVGNQGPVGEQGPAGSAADTLAALKAGVPQTDPAVAGAIWNDSGTLKVSAG